VSSGGSFGANPLRQEIGLGDATTIDQIEIFWPATGKTKVMKDLRPDPVYHVSEDANVAEPVSLKAVAFKPADPAHHHHHHHHQGE